jgi:hypothetical protein
MDRCGPANPLPGRRILPVRVPPQPARPARASARSRPLGRPCLPAPAGPLAWASVRRLPRPRPEASRLPLVHWQVVNRVGPVSARAAAPEVRQASARMRRSGGRAGPRRRAGAQEERGVHPVAYPGPLGADQPGARPRAARWAREEETASDTVGWRTVEPGWALQTRHPAGSAGGSNPAPMARAPRAPERRPMGRSPDRSGRSSDRRASASAHGEDPAAHDDDTASPRT